MRTVGWADPIPSLHSLSLPVCCLWTPPLQSNASADAAEAEELAAAVAAKGKGKGSKHQRQQQAAAGGKKASAGGAKGRAGVDAAPDPRRQAELEMLLMDDAALLAAAHGCWMVSGIFASEDSWGEGGE